MASRPLEGLLVADFSRVLAGPLATQTLADLGADVVKVERPQAGDDTRAWGASYFLGLNRGKRSITLDLKDDEDVALARRLCERADVVVESFRPGVMERLGLGPGVSPHAVFCSITAFGEHDLPGYDLLLQAVSGLMHVTGEEDGRPLKVGAAVIDLVCGLHAAVGILASLRDPLRPPVTVSLMDSALTALVNQASAHLNEGAAPTRLGNRHPSIAPYETFPASDGELAVACGNDAMFTRLAAASGSPGSRARSASRRTTRGSRTGTSSRPRSAPRSRATPSPAGSSACAPPASPPAPINDVGAAFAYAEELGLDPVWSSTASAPSAHRCAAWPRPASARRTSASTRTSSAPGSSRTPARRSLGRDDRALLDVGLRPPFRQELVVDDLAERRHLVVERDVLEAAPGGGGS